MDLHPITSATRSVSTPRPNALSLAIIRASSGDVNLAAMFRTAAWDTYVEAGSPYGYSEVGLNRWWEERLTFNVN